MHFHASIRSIAMGSKPLTRVPGFPELTARFHHPQADLFERHYLNSCKLNPLN